MPQETNMVQASKTTFEILEALKHLDGAGVTELSNHLGFPKSTIHNHLRTLEDCEFVVSEDNEYRVGLRFLDFGEFVSDRVDLLNAAKEEVDRLTEETGELANLMVEEHDRGVYVYQARGERAVSTDLHTGKRVHLHQTGLGKAIMAYYPGTRVDEIVDHRGLPDRTQNTITHRDDLDEELAAIEERGYAYDDEEWLRGLRCVAAPIRDTDNRAIGAIGVSGPTSRMQGDRYRTEVPDMVQSAANVIELNIEYPNN